MLLNLRYHHTHQCWRKECYCEYCQFINSTYVANKFQLHHLKKKLNWYEYHDLNWNQTFDHITLISNMKRQRQHIKELKKRKKELQMGVL
jgi:hypothetical protein